MRSSASRGVARPPAYLGAAGRQGAWDGAALALLAVLVVLVVATYRDYGMSWDEPEHEGYGKRILAYYAALTRGGWDAGALTHSNLYLYGGAFDAPAEAINAVVPGDRFDTRHLLTALGGLVGVAGCWRLGRTLGGPRAGFMAAALLALTPLWYGHMFANPKDIPFGAGTAWTLALMAAALGELPRLTARRILSLGVALGLTIGVRIGGILLAAYWVAAVAIWAWRSRRVLQGDRRGNMRGAGVRVLVASVALPLLVAYGVMLVAWPWAQVAPVAHPIQALQEMSRFDWPFTVLFRGAFVLASDLPRSYLPVQMAITLPEGLLLALVAAAVAGLAWARRRVPTLQAAGVALVLASILLPIGIAIGLRSTLYDGMRHFLFAVPSLAVIAALGIDATIRRLRPAPPILAVLAGTAAAGWLVLHVADLVRLHPYQYVYYNRLVGGVPGAFGRYETDYWGCSYREAVSLLERHLDASPEPPRDRPYAVEVCSEPMLSTHYFSSRLALAPSSAEADFFVATTRWNCDRTVEGRTVATVSRMGTPLAFVKDLRVLLGARLAPPTAPSRAGERLPRAGSTELPAQRILP